MKCIECEVCGKVFTNSAKGYKAEYYLKTHRKTCITKFKKKQLRECKDWLMNKATEIDINRLYLYIKNPNQSVINIEPPLPPEQFRDYSPIRSVSPISKCSDTSENIFPFHKEDLERPASNTSVSSNASTIYEDWKYEHQNYIVNDKGVVYDEFDNIVGVRKMDDFNGEYKLIMD